MKRIYIFFSTQENFIVPRISVTRHGLNPTERSTVATHGLCGGQVPQSRELAPEEAKPFVITGLPSMSTNGFLFLNQTDFSTLARCPRFLWASLECSPVSFSSLLCLSIARSFMFDDLGVSDSPTTAPFPSMRVTSLFLTRFFFGGNLDALHGDYASRCLAFGVGTCLASIGLL